MENDPNSSNSEKYQLTWSSDELLGISQVKFYRCSFCKRGFSNAQALGGHMNIHRKDRAKLREISIENSDIKKSVSLSPNILTPSGDELLQQQVSSDDTSSPSKRPCVTSEEERNHHHLLQLPLFVDSQSKEVINCVEKQEGNKGMQLSVDSELDLELRLGPEPPESSIKP
ncbi:hypothetical protein K7X08_015866 [Anisodus acutangulus]|uniref:C2H2-type domain-containing protein n=1 Tax=Anisodus acutangulus TaxID=402998 RepID=A0A9Q1LC92_9SOLA|nr:hypothetical protein K7X08_015866 [Anisodus acutangulus]